MLFYKYLMVSCGSYTIFLKFCYILKLKACRSNGLIITKYFKRPSVNLKKTSVYQ